MTGYAFLLCERCGKADDAPLAPVLPDWATFSGPLICTVCGEPLTLLTDCKVGGHFEKGRRVVSEYDLPTRR